MWETQYMHKQIFNNNIELTEVNHFCHWWWSSSLIVTEGTFDMSARIQDCMLLVVKSLLKA